MRTQYCREHIEKVAEECGLSDDTVRSVKKATQFVEGHPEFSNSSTKAILTILYIKDNCIKDVVVSKLSGLLLRRTPTGGRFCKCVTIEHVRRVIKSIEKTSECTSGFCDICGSPFTKMNKPQKDHDHKTGKWRGILCTRCNTTIGAFEDNEELMQQAISYVHRWRNLNENTRV